jgi:hypothetical protein
MIRIRFLTAESLACLMVKTAKEQVATQTDCPKKNIEQQPKHYRLIKKTQKKDGPEKQVRPFVSLS